MDVPEYLFVGVFYPMGTHGDIWGYMGIYGGLWGSMGVYGYPWGSMGVYGDCLHGSPWGWVGTSVRIWKRTSKGSWEDLTEDHQTPTGHSPGPKAVVGVSRRVS